MRARIRPAWDSREPWSGYVGANADGDDGGPLSDYDIIGSLPRRTGIFALGPDTQFDLLYIPPLTRDQDLGMSTLLVAARFCRERRALQIVDPPQAWTQPQEALDGLAAWPFRSDNAAMFFPRLLAFDRLRNRMARFAPGAAAAGMLARTDCARGPWLRAQEPEAALRPMLRPAVASKPQVRRAAGAGGHQHAGAAAARSGAARAQLHAVQRGLGVRRGALPGRAPPGAAAGQQRRARHALGAHRPELPQRPGSAPATRSRSSWSRCALEGHSPRGEFADCCLVVWDERVNRASTIATGAVNLLFGYALQQPGALQYWLVTHHPAGSRVRPVSINRQAASPRRVDWEIETAILNA